MQDSQVLTRNRTIDLIGTAVATAAGFLIVVTSMLHMCGFEVGNGPLRWLLWSLAVCAGFTMSVISGRRR